MELKDLENILQTIYEAKENGGIINVKDEAVKILAICNGIKTDVINEVEALEWWDGVPIQNIVNPGNSQASYVSKYFPDRTDYQDITADDIKHIWKHEMGNDKLIDGVVHEWSNEPVGTNKITVHFGNQEPLEFIPNQPISIHTLKGSDNVIDNKTGIRINVHNNNDFFAIVSASSEILTLFDSVKDIISKFINK